MDEKDKQIESLRKQLQDALRKVSALEQEVALLNYENDKLKNSYGKTNDQSKQGQVG